MAALTWNDALALQQPQMDQTHREFVDLLAAVEAALAQPPAQLQAAYTRFVAHTEAHFEQEERWMVALGFAPQNCHSVQHAQVLQLLHEMARRLQTQAEPAPMHLLVPGLAEWFPVHAQSMDAALAQTMAEQGFDPVTGIAAQPAQA
jgi:hemerythrin